MRLVVLSACYSEVQAVALAKHVDAVVGMAGAIGDEAFVSLSADVGGSALLLHMDTRFPLRPPAPPWTRAYTAAFWLSLSAGGGAAAWHFQAFWPTVGAVITVLLAWIVPDIALQIRKERIARRRVLDEAAWQERLIAAIG